MSDLEDDLLALAGGEDYESEEEISSSKRKITRDYSEDENEDDTVLAKRRKVETDDYDDGSDDDNDEEEEEELVNPYPLEGKYKDEQDRDDLEDMDEVKREQILFEREQEMDRYNEKKYLQQRMKSQNQQTKKSSEKLRSSSRVKAGTGKSNKENKLSELKKQREKASRRRTRREEEYDDGSEEEDEDEEDEESLGSENDYLDDENQEIWGGVSKSRHKKSTTLGKLEDINRIRVGRSLLAQYCYHSGFEDAVVDTYTKVNVGMDRATRQPMYRMVKIIESKSRPEKPYKIGNSKYDLYFLVSQNKNQKKPFPMNMFSDSPITKEELNKYLIELDKTGESIDFLEDINEKHKQLQQLFNKGLTDKDINEMIAKKQQIQQEKGNYTTYDAVKQKAKLMDELKINKQQGNLENTKHIIEEIKNIENILDNKPDLPQNQSKKQNISKVNERNRKYNLDNIRKAEIKFKSDLNNSNFDSGDPFSRLKTTTRMFYQDLINQENEKALKNLNMQELINEKSKQEAKIADSTYRDLGVLDKLINSIDLEIELFI
ncbi:RTF1 [Candida pseudojiufengensis]|uniref:RTF1 n=1 Tax=Candida pseudojiufengensis TaxID=497109 RepID=UPI002223FA87|nr:RTF1 [Candida pseudojiufengensis]KAI5959744.1 RTF1 [Candida pseudojiufengensis]